MPWWVTLLISAGAALLLAWVALIVALWRAEPGRSGIAEGARLLPDLLRLLSRLARDRTLPRGIRVRLWLLLGYLASPIDLVPDFVPVDGYAADADVDAIALRSVVRAAGVEPLERHWPGSPDGLAVVRRLAGVTPERGRRG